MTLSELINWHRAEGIAAWKKYEHALTHGLKCAARFRRAFLAYGDTVEALTELHCRRQEQLRSVGFGDPEIDEILGEENS
jgi:hypothetical protein